MLRFDRRLIEASCLSPDGSLPVSRIEVRTCTVTGPAEGTATRP